MAVNHYLVLFAVSPPLLCTYRCPLHIMKLRNLIVSFVSRASMADGTASDKIRLADAFSKGRSPGPFSWPIYASFVGLPNSYPYCRLSRRLTLLICKSGSATASCMLYTCEWLRRYQGAVWKLPFNMQFGRRMDHTRRDPYPRYSG